MNRKRTDSETNDQDDQTGSLSSPKRLKNRLASSIETKRNHGKDTFVDSSGEQSESKMKNGYFDANQNPSASLDSDSSTQSSTDIYPSRKRRARATQDNSASNISADSSATYILPNTASQTRKKSELSCVVCYGLAHGYNFDAISCESCKAFFRRNALHNSDRLKCRRDGACEITLETRRRCKSCRLKKCFAVGMKKEWILTEEEKQNKKRRIEENRRLRLLTLNPEAAVHEVASIPTQSPNEKISSELQSVVLDQNRLSESKSSAALNNGEVIANVVTAFNDGFQLNPTSYGWSYPLAKKLTALSQILNTKNTTALRLISFYKRLPEFDSLHENDKVNLVKTNLPYIFIYHASLGYDPINDIYHEGIPTNDTLLYGSDIREAHGENIYARCTSIMRSLHSIVQLDKRIMQLALIIMLFMRGLSTSSNPKDATVMDAQQVLQAQNFYIEHLWVFMEKYYGTTRTVRTFLALSSKFLLIQTLLRDIEQDLHKKLDADQVPPLMRTLMNFS